MSTGRPVSTPVDHARWEEERKRLESLAKDASGAFVKITDPILDNRWAMLLGGVACSLLVFIALYMVNKMESLSSKQDMFLDRVSDLKSQIVQESAERAVIKVQVNAIQERVQQHDARFERLERRP